jgi:thioredoxin reductase (NADPH)
MMKKAEIAIIGGGSSGMMAALRAVLNNNSALFFMGSSKTKKRSRAQWVSRVENMPGYHSFKKGILNPNQETLQFIESSNLAHKLQKIPSSVIKIEKTQDGFILTDDKEDLYQAQYLVLATGVMDVQPHIQGSIEPVLPYANNQLIDYCLRCDGHHALGKKTSVIGHTDGAGQVAIILKERYDCPQMSILTNGEAPQLSAEVKKLLDLYHVNIYTSPIRSIEGRPSEKILTSFTLEDGSIIPSEISFVSLGTIVYHQLAKDLGCDLDERGFVKTNAKSESSVSGVYAVGDIQAGKKNQIYTGWDLAVDALDDINMKIRYQRRQMLIQKNAECK